MKQPSKMLSAITAWICLLIMPSVVLAALCSDIFSDPSGENPNLLPTGNTLDLSGVTWQSSPWPGSPATLTSGQYFYTGTTLPQDYELNIQAGANVIIFVDGNLSLPRGATLNASGLPEELTVVINGNASFLNNSNNQAHKNIFNGLLYTTGAIAIGNNNDINGILAAEGAISSGNRGFTYDADAVNTDLLTGLCEAPNTPLLAIDTFESYPLESITGMNGGTGWGGSWQGGAGQSIVDNFNNPLIYDDGTGRSIRSQRSLEITGNDDRMATRAIGGTFSGDRYFASMLVRFEGPVQNNDFLGFWVDSPGYGDSPQFGIKTNEGGGGSQDFFVRLDQSGAYSEQLVPGETYLLVAEFSKNGTSYFNDSKLWVNPSCEAAPPTFAQITKDPTNQVSSFSEVGLRSTNLDNGQRVQVGQLAMGETWEDVVRCSPGPLLSYRMEEEEWTGTTGEVLDDSGNDRHGTPQGGVNTVPNMPNEAAIAGNPGTCGYGSFEGDGGIRENSAGSYLNGLEAITVMGWVYNTAPLAGNDRGIFTTASPTGKDNRLALRYDVDGLYTDNSNVIKASVFTEDCNSNQECLQVETESDVMAVDQWQHVAMTWSRGGLIRVFVNGLPVGVSVTRSAGGDGPLAKIDWLDIGQGTKSQRWQGRMDEFRIFGYSMTDAEIAAEMNRTFPCESQLDHIRIEHTGTGLTCQPSDITLRACVDAACITEAPTPVTVTMTPSSANPPTWINGDAYSFTGNRTVQLRQTVSELVTLGIADTNPVPTNNYRCYNAGVEGDCNIEFFDTGFIFDVPDLTSCRQSSSVAIQAVRMDDTTQTCIADGGFADVNKDIGFWNSYVNPASGSEQVAIDGTAISTTSPGTAISLNFDASATAFFKVGYPDAGEVQLNARYDGIGTEESDLVMLGNDGFIARPVGLCVYSDETASDCVSGNADCSVFRKAEENFTLKVKGVCWESSGDGDFCSGNATTPNFELSNIPLSPNLIAPTSSGSSTGSLGVTSVGITSADNGEHSITNQSVSEVGVFTITAIPPNYFGEPLPAATSVNIGRFTPDHFETTIVNNGVLQDGCSGFTYTGQTFTYDAPDYPEMQITAKGSGTNTTLNYRDDFVKFVDPATNIVMPAVTSDATNLGADNTTLLNLTWTPESSSLVANNDGTLNFTLGADQFTYTREANALVAPIDSDIQLPVDSIADGDGVAASDLPRSFTPAATQIRYGRLLLQNAYGPETQPLTILVQTEYYTGSAFTLNDADSCTPYTFADLALNNYQENLQSGDTSASGSGTVISGLGNNLSLSAPGVDNDGSVEVTLDLSQAGGADMEWLQFDWDGDGSNDNPTAKATFGIFEGNQGMIYMRESVW